MNVFSSFLVNLFVYLRPSASIVLLVWLFSKCHTSQSLPLSPPSARVSDQKCYFNGKLTPAERLNRLPFKGDFEVKVVSFSKYNMAVPVGEDSLLIRRSLIDNITLNRAQIDSLTNIFYNYNYSPKTTLFNQINYACYEPRHAVVMLNQSGKVINYFECCFECEKFVSNLPDEHWGNFCEGKYKLLKEMFSAFGVKYTGPAEPN
jgi:hypothetical protein